MRSNGGMCPRQKILKSEVEKEESEKCKHGQHKITLKERTAVRARRADGWTQWSCPRCQCGNPRFAAMTEAESHEPRHGLQFQVDMSDVHDPSCEAMDGAEAWEVLTGEEAKSGTSSSSSSVYLHALMSAAHRAYLTRYLPRFFACTWLD